MAREFTFSEINCMQITASDLRGALRKEPPTRNVRCIRIEIQDETGNETSGQAVIYVEGIEGRIGISTNADAQWGDFLALQGPFDCWSAINDYLNDADAWEARN